MKENHINSEVVRSLELDGFWAYKIPDVLGSRFTARKPFDVVAESKKGRFISIEGKLIKKWEAFSLKKLADHQIINLNRTGVKRDGRAFVFLYIRIPREASYIVVFNWKKYKTLLKKGLTAKELKTKKHGVWLSPGKDDMGKIYWPLKKLMSY